MRKPTVTLVILLIIACASSWANNARADILSTPFNSNNGQAGNMFDVNVLNAVGITVESFDLNLDPGTWNLEVYVINSAYAGFETTPGAWTLIDSISGLASAGTDNPTTWDFADVDLDAGTHAFYVTVTNGTSMNYTNGTSEGAVLAADANLEILQGVGKGYPFGATFRPRNWNGSIQYSVRAIPEPNTLAVLFVSAGIGGLFYRRRSYS